MTTSRQRGRPNKSLVTRANIATVAVKIVSDKGYEALTMTSIARELGVATSALYNHVPNKAELLVLLQDEVMREVDDSPLDAAIHGAMGPRTSLKRWATAYRNTLAEHVPLIEFIATFPIARAPLSIALYDKAIQVLLLGGVPDTDALPTLVALESFIFGSAFDTHAPANIYDTLGSDIPAPHLQNAVEIFVNGISESTTATQEPTSPQRTGASPTTNPYADAPFDSGLERLLRDVSDSHSAH
nr:TetR/AcrR family transcriptional regulator [Corynebacterium lactis]